MSVALKHDAWITLGRLTIAYFEDLGKCTAGDIERMLMKLQVAGHFQRFKAGPTAQLAEDRDACEEILAVARRYEKSYRQLSGQFRLDLNLDASLLDTRRAKDGAAGV